MKKEPKIRFSERTRITQKFDANGKVTASFSERTIIAKPSSEKAKKLKAIEDLQKLSDDLKISGTFANEIARIVKGWKVPKNWKRCRNLKTFIVTAKNDLLFKRTLDTVQRQLKLAAYFYGHAGEYGIDEQGKAKLIAVMRDQYSSLMLSYPKEFPGLPEYVFSIGKALNVPTRFYRDWYANFRDVPDWSTEETSDEEIMAFFESERAKALANASQ